MEVTRELPVSGHPICRRHRTGTRTMNDVVQASPERVPITVSDRFPADETY
jgi:hypothetical protein